MTNYHCTVKMISRQGGKSTVASLAYRTGTQLADERTGETWDYTKKNVGHVEILIPENAPKWISDISELCKTDKQAALQKFSDIVEAAEKRKDSQVYREIEFSLPNELTKEQNIKWATEYLNDYAVKRGMVCVPSFHFDYDEKTGTSKPHCHALLLTRELTEEGLSPKKQLEWNEKSFLHDWREQCAAYQNSALKELGFEARVDHRSYADRDITEIEAQPKLGKNVREMEEKGIQTDKQKLFDMVKLKNQFQILKNPELVFSIVTANHSTFTYQDVAKVLHRYIDDPQQYQILYDRLLASNELVCINKQDDAKETPAIYTTRKMLSNEIELVRKAEALATQNTHPVKQKIIEKVIAHHNKKLEKHGGMTPDQERAVRHMLGPQQLCCVVGFAGSGKTTSLEASNDAWKAMGYKVIGVAPTGKAAEAMEGSGIRSMTLHKFLRAHETGHEKIGCKTVLVLDEAGMVDSRRINQLLTIIAKSGAKHVVMGDNGQTQSIEAGPAFRLVTDRVKPVALETIVRQNVDWQRQASHFFGKQETRKALKMYQDNGLMKIVSEKGLEDRTVVEQYCLARQISGRIWKDMGEDLGLNKATTGQVKGHQDFDLYIQWKDERQKSMESIIKNFDTHESELKAKGLDLRPLVEKWRQAPLGQTSEIARNMENSLREMSYKNVVDTKVEAKKALVDDWVLDRAAAPNKSHLMIAYSNKDANDLNKSARALMREAGAITGEDYTFTTISTKEDDFGREIATKETQKFAKGDRLLFMRNDGSLKVRNGTLGSITEISKTKIKVLIDGDDKHEVSFSPRLYPYFNNGWGTSIHKSQGATLDEVKKLDDFNEYKNLSYVGMTRHRDSIKTYGSNLDFWREEKVIDRLSRVQEKLSGLDYLDYNNAFEQLKTDERTLWHERKIQQGKDLFNAVKVTSKSVMDIVLKRPREKLDNPETFKSFDHSEEKRSVQFFGVNEGKKGSEKVDYQRGKTNQATQQSVISSSPNVFKEEIPNEMSNMPTHETKQQLNQKINPEMKQESPKAPPYPEKSTQPPVSTKSKIVKVLSTSYDLDPKSIDPKTINQIQGQLKIIEEAYKAESIPLSGQQKNHHLKQLCMLNQLSKDCLDQYTDQNTPSQARETAIQKSIINVVYLEKSSSAHIRPPYIRLETANYYNDQFKKDVAKTQEIIHKLHPALDDHAVKSLATAQVTLRTLTENELTFLKFVQQKAETIKANQGSILSAARDLAKEVSPHKGAFELKETEDSARKSIVSQMVRQGPLTETSQYSQVETAKNAIVKDLSNHQRGIQQTAIQNRLQMEQRQHEQMQR